MPVGIDMFEVLGGAIVSDFFSTTDSFCEFFVCCTAAFDIEAGEPASVMFPIGCGPSSAPFARHCWGFRKSEGFVRSCLCAFPVMLLFVLFVFVESIPGMPEANCDAEAGLPETFCW